jgi:uncharacterized protein (DUF4415 family)
MKMSTNKLKAELAALDELSEGDIDYGDIPPVGSQPDRLRNPAVGRLYKPLKIQKTLRLDADLVGLFQSTGKGYQTLINAMLRETVDLAELFMSEVQVYLDAGRFDDAARLIATQISRQPSTKAYIAARVRAIVLNILSTPSRSEFKSLKFAMEESPEFLQNLEERAAEPALFLSTVRAALELSDKRAINERKKKSGTQS